MTNSEAVYQGVKDAACACAHVRRRRSRRPVQAAIDDRAKVVLGGTEHDGAYPATIRPIFPKVRARHGVLGPVAQFYRVSGEDEAIAVANDSPYGSRLLRVYHRQRPGLRFADRLEST